MVASDCWRDVEAVPAGAAVGAAAVAVAGGEPVASGDAGAEVAKAADNVEALAGRRGMRLAWGYRRSSEAARLAGDDER